MRILFPLLLLSWLPGFSQNLSLNLVGRLPNELSETSGLTITPSGKIWSHNDSGNDPNLYEISGGGSILRTIHIENTNNTDWEDLAIDDQGRIYIGDFGNNSNNRQDLAIYRIADPGSLSSDTLRADTIAFHYANQRGFPPNTSDWNFDCEAFFWFQDSLYLFTKNRTNPFNGYTNMYRIPAEPGMHTAVLADSFFTGLGLKEQYWICAADISPDGKRMVLLGYDKLWLFHCYKGTDFFGGGVREMTLGGLTQKEAIAFLNQTELHITDEEFFISGKNLYKTDLGIWADSLKLSLGDTIRGSGMPVQLDAGHAGGKYSWSNGDTTQSIEVTQEGTYSLEINLNGCIARDEVYVMIPTSLDGAIKKDPFKVTVSPNPFTDYTDILCDLPASGTVKIELYDTTGQKVAAFIYPQEAAGPQRYRLSRHVLSLSPGKYILTVSHNEKQVKKQIVKY